MDDDDGAWFAPKRYGYGAGLPVAWQGWALLAGHIAVLLALAALLPHRPVLFVTLAVVLSAPVLAITAQHTRGGWRWRWGGD